MGAGAGGGRADGEGLGGADAGGGAVVSGLGGEVASAAGVLRRVTCGGSRVKRCFPWGKGGEWVMMD